MRELSKEEWSQLNESKLDIDQDVQSTKEEPVEEAEPVEEKVQEVAEPVFEMPSEPVKVVKQLKKRVKNEKLEVKTRGMKQMKLKEEIAQVPSDNFDTILDNINDKGASFLKYEFIKKRDAKTGKEKKVLQAKRRSARHACMGLETSIQPLDTFEQNKMKIDMSFEYNPSQVEHLFGKGGKESKI